VFSYRVRKYVGAYLAVLGGADAVIFSGGIGENTAFVRHYVCEGLNALGIRLDEALNETTMNGDVCISLPDSPVQAWVIHSDEALMIAHEAVNCR
jgi:acetate kinase